MPPASVLICTACLVAASGTRHLERHNEVILRSMAYNYCAGEIDVQAAWFRLSDSGEFIKHRDFLTRVILLQGLYTLICGRIWVRVWQSRRKEGRV